MPFVPACESLAPMLRRRSLAPVLLALSPLCGLARPAQAADRWIEIRSPHFRVLSDGSSGEARNAAFQFEQMRSVFEAEFPTFQLEGGAPLTIVAARDEGTAKALEGPTLWKARGSRLAGFFEQGWERRLALVRLDTFTSGKEVVYHEYAHSILHANAHWLPMWVDEGEAEFYAYTRFEEKRTLLGAPTVRYGALHGTLIPVKTMLTVNGRSPILKDDNRTQVFYAESWAMIHYMIFGPEMGSGKKLGEFLHLLDQQTDQQVAFEKVFGDTSVFDRNLQTYLLHLTMQAAVIPTNPAIDKKAFAERTLSPAETAFELGAFHIGLHDAASGRPLIERSLQLDPNMGAAHEELGFLDFADGKDDDARREWHQAFALDPTLFRSLYAETMSGTPLRQQTPEQLHTTLLALQKVAKTNRNFAPAYIEIAMLRMQEGDFEAALAASRQAEVFEPWRSGYHVLTARIYLDLGKDAVAASFARYVAEHWYGSDHDEAVDLWNEIPAADRGSEPGPTLNLAPGLSAMNGTITGVVCSDPGKDRTVAVTVQPGNAPTSAPVTFNAAHAGVGFTDTLWWGEDHFGVCHHLVGRRVVMIFHPTGESGGELRTMQVRDDPPPGPGHPASVTGAQASN